MNDNQLYSIITGSGSYVPPVILKNQDFTDRPFLNEDGTKVENTGDEIVKKFEEITDISERRIAEPQHKGSDLATFAAQEAIRDSGIDPEKLDYIIVAHNLGDMDPVTLYPDIMPTLASRVKKKLDIKNPKTVAYDMTFGCPGWTQAMIQANYYLRSGDAKSALVIGADTLSRAMDPHDRDSMIFADGAGAVVVEAMKSAEPTGILRHVARTDTRDHLDLLKMGNSYNQELKTNIKFVKMLGRKVYNYGLTYVPEVAKECLEINNLDISDVSKILIHQANAKMDEAISSMQPIFKPCLFSTTSTKWPASMSDENVPVSSHAVPRPRIPTCSFPFCR